MSYEVKIRFVLDRECSYFRSSKPFKRKIRFWEIHNVHDNPALIKAIDEAFNSASLDEKEKMSESLKEWKRIKQSRKLSLYAFYFKRPFKHEILKGKEIYGITFFDLMTLIHKSGRTKEFLGFFKEPPLTYYAPPSKEEWMMRKLQELRDEGRIRTAEDIRRHMRALSKQYRRAVEKRKFIIMLWIPTWTTKGYMEIVQRTQNVDKLVRVWHEASSELAPKIAQAESLEKKAEALELTVESLVGEIRTSHRTTSKLVSEVEEKDRLLKETRRPVVYHPAGRPEIAYQPPPPVTGRITQAFKGIEPSTWITFMLAIGALACMILGINQYMLDPNRWGLMILGFLLLACSIVVYLFKMRTRVPQLEVRERAETVAEEIAG